MKGNKQIYYKTIALMIMFNFLFQLYSKETILDIFGPISHADGERKG